MMNAFSYLDINIFLTDKGFDYYEDVLQIVWARINDLKNSGPQEYVYKEMSEYCRLSWQFFEKNDAYNFVSTISERMQIFEESNINDILTTQYLFKGFNQEGIEKVLEYLTPSNMIMNIYSQNHGKRLTDENSDEGESEGEDEEDDGSSSEESDHGIQYQKEPWYGAKYVKEKISQALLDKMINPKIPEECKMGDPPVNNMFPHDLSILPETEIDPKIPQMIYNDHSMEIWHQKCTKFNVPTVIYIDNFYSNDCGYLDTVEGRVFIQLWTTIVSEYFREYNYMAGQANLYFSIGYDVETIELYFSGYADRLEEFIIS